jgi:hypothetical protein
LVVADDEEDKEEEGDGGDSCGMQIVTLKVKMENNSRKLATVEAMKDKIQADIDDSNAVAHMGNDMKSCCL